MSEVSADQLKQAVEGQHGGMATLVNVVPVKEVFEGRTVWEGVVHVFDLHGNAKAIRAYAWSSPVESSDKRRFQRIFVEAPSRETKGLGRQRLVRKDSSRKG
jgi:hypothetical protein